MTGERGWLTGGADWGQHEEWVKHDPKVFERLKPRPRMPAKLPSAAQQEADRLAQRRAKPIVPPSEPPSWFPWP